MTALTSITIDSATANRIEAGIVIDAERDGLESLWNRRIYRWTSVWNTNKSLSDMQSQIDLIASSGNLPSLLAIAAAEIAIISTYRADLFAQAVAEVSGMLQPNSQPYRKYVSPGWYYTTTTDLMTYPSGMIFSSPVIWSS